MAEPIVAQKCGPGELAVSVEGGSDMCGKIPICSGSFPGGYCPEAQPALPEGSHCGIVRTGVYGCKRGPGSGTDITLPGPTSVPNDDVGGVGSGDVPPVTPGTPLAPGLPVLVPFPESPEGQPITLTPQAPELAPFPDGPQGNPPTGPEPKPSEQVQQPPASFQPENPPPYVPSIPTTISEPVGNQPAPGPVQGSFGPPASVNIMNQRFADLLVQQHSIARAQHGLGPVTWSDEVASLAQSFANSCPGFRHDQRSDVPKDFENLASAPSSCADEASCKSVNPVALWYASEEPLWLYDQNRCKGDWAECGHFSNMLSPGATVIGCGASNCGSGQSYVWCRYRRPEINPVIPVRGGWLCDQPGVYACRTPNPVQTQGFSAFQNQEGSAIAANTDSGAASAAPLPTTVIIIIAVLAAVIVLVGALFTVRRRRQRQGKSAAAALGSFVMTPAQLSGTGTPATEVPFADESGAKVGA